MAFIWVALGSALGGVLRYGFTLLTLRIDSKFPWSTLAVNVLGSFLIGYFGTLTLPGTRYAASEHMRTFVMIGICGGFTTFSSFSLQSFDLLRGGAWGRALVNIGLSVGLCLAAVGVGHHVGQRGSGVAAVAETASEELSG